jgi:transcriptional regulator with XRE-family HTH domain
MEIKRLVGQNLQKVRKEKGLSQETLAFDSGIHRTYISGVERGIRNPTATVLYRIARALDVPTARLFDGEERIGQPAKPKSKR